jgi:hypothetical protein
MFFLLPPINEKQLVCLLDSNFLPSLVAAAMPRDQKKLQVSDIQCLKFPLSLLETSGSEPVPGLRRPKFGTHFWGRALPRGTISAGAAKLARLVDPLDS